MLNVVSVEFIECDEPVDVYDIELDGEDCFIAEGACVHNSYICMALSGGAWNLDTGEPLPGSATQVPYPGRPPLHFRCRSTMTAVVKPYSALLKSTEDRTRYHSQLLDLDNEKKRQLDAALPINQNYAEFLSKQSVAKQREKLGPRRYQLWKDGRIGLRDLIDQSGRPLTIAELEARH